MQIDRLTKKYNERKKDLQYTNHKWAEISRITFSSLNFVKWNIQFKVYSHAYCKCHDSLTAWQTIYLS